MEITYWQFAHGLADFGLITREQADAWLTEKQSAYEDYLQRRDEFIEAFVDDRPRWRKLLDPGGTEWRALNAWFEHESGAEPVGAGSTTGGEQGPQPRESAPE